MIAWSVHAVEVVGERLGVVDDLHAAAAEHVAGAHEHGVSDAARRPRSASSRFVAVPFFGASRPASSRIPENSPRSSARSIASGVVPRIGTPASLSPCASPSAVWPPSCTTTPTSSPDWDLRVDDLEHVLECERLEVEPVARVVVGRDRLGVAVDHDRLEARRRAGRTRRARTSSRTRRPGRCGSARSRG